MPRSNEECAALIVAEKAKILRENLELATRGQSAHRLNIFGHEGEYDTSEEIAMGAISRPKEHVLLEYNAFLAGRLQALGITRDELWSRDFLIAQSPIPGTEFLDFTVLERLAANYKPGVSPPK